MVESEVKLVSKIISKYIKDKPTRITLRLDWENKNSTIIVEGENLNERRKIGKEISFSSFAKAVLEAYKKEYGDLNVIP
ncbi:MAG: hypothetical protein DRN04_12995 [Thermoprotei archaeon]|nr:MAG: hypothetical protein DRN04_12995 [Thermoprotei archaeon]